MGVGYAEDLVVSVALGADMFDCVYPTRTARFGNAITRFGVLNLRHNSFATDFRPVDTICTCPTCVPMSQGGIGASRAFLYHLACKETAGAHLLTLHNVHYQLDLMRQIRTAIVEDCFPSFIASFFFDLYGGNRKKYPEWAVGALRTVGVNLVPLDEGDLSHHENISFLKKSEEAELL